MSNINEEWRYVCGTYPHTINGRYLVSDHGRVMSLNYNGTNKPMIMKPQRQHTGYMSVNLRMEDGRQKQCYIHRLVMMAFQPTNDEDLQVDHINHDRSDNRLSNLRWVSRKQNNSTEHSKRMRSLNSKRKAHKGFVIKASKDGVVEYLKKQCDVAYYIGCSNALVARVLSGHDPFARKACGWDLEYVKEGL